MTDLKDFAYLEMAYGLAEKARGWASPNPYVGAVVVRRNAIIGHGFHERPGRPHAEAVALERAGRLARGSTLYVTLEPCIHWGRTPPCVDAVIRARPRRVVVSSLDPNPIVFQKGIRRLRAAGIDVSVGLLQERNVTLNESYIKYITRGIPFVTLKAALSLDGRTATRTKNSRWISHPLSRNYVHLLRGEQDAILVGIQTLIKDDPLLTVRHPQWAGKKILRVILDSQLRFPLRARILSTLPAGNVIVFAVRGAASRKRALLERRGIEVIEIPGPRTRVNIAAVLANLGKRGIASLLVEGGSRLLTAMIEGRFADKLMLTVSPRLIGGSAAPSFLEGEGVRLVQDSYPVRRVSSFTIGDDIVIEGYL
ncbi:MAG: bifunctional diaminohydroxyphosphoribosylaminopyrimidine deaminase/5-amino-6-(5-phosphoribosylamino)uracil reductase RibD [Candidatus Aminicenantales bacterium]